jgi:hypothetical protein
MLAIVSFNILMLLLAGAIFAGLVPARWFSSFMDLLHNTIGISTPTEPQIRLALLVWIASTLVIVDGLLYLIRFVF